MKRRFVNILFVSITFIAGILFFSGNDASANNEGLPEEVLRYAEEVALPNLKGIDLGTVIPDPYTQKDFMLGEGMPVYLINNTDSAENFGAVFGDVAYYYFIVETPDHTPVSSIQIYVNNDGSYGEGGGADSYHFSASLNKMRELIRKSGGSGEPRILIYGLCYLAFYSFGNDERILLIEPPAYADNEFLDVSDYRQLPTGAEALDAIRSDLAEKRRQMEENGGEMMIGGTDIHLTTHKTASSNWIFPAIAAGGAVLIVGSALFFGMLKRKSRRNN